jgi:hypothetical protein
LKLKKKKRKRKTLFPTYPKNKNQRGGEKKEKKTRDKQ